MTAAWAAAGAGPRVVALGGGHGLARVLGALRSLDIAPTAVVTVADDGGSSGRLRRDLGIIAPGDLRMALLALARHGGLAQALGHRFQRGQLEGHAVGNLLLVALAEQCDGDFLTALERAGRLLDCQGTVLPATTAPVQLHAQVAGRRVDGQARVAAAAGRIERIWLEPDQPPACAEAVAAIRGADAVVLGPGSLFTSIVVHLLVPEIAAALAATPAAMLYVANVRTQPGETSGLDAAAHVEAVLAHLPGRELDAVVLHDGPVSAEPPGSAPLGVPEALERVASVVRADLASRDAAGHTDGTHDERRLAEVLRPLLPGLAAEGAR